MLSLQLPFGIELLGRGASAAFLVAKPVSTGCDRTTPLSVLVQVLPLPCVVPALNVTNNRTDKAAKIVALITAKMTALK
jgi:hypothetical protein